MVSLLEESSFQGVSIKTIHSTVFTLITSTFSYCANDSQMFGQCKVFRFLAKCSGCLLCCSQLQHAAIKCRVLVVCMYI